MPRNPTFGSLTKEPPLSKLDDTIRAIIPDMPYVDLLRIGRSHTHRDAPGLVRQRFILVDDTETIVYDRFLSLVASEGLATPRIRKIMYFVWAFRDERFRRYILERIADASGKWQVGELTNKANADFFTAWFKQSTATKIRSNIEFFFAKSAILERQTDTIHLELDDGWLAEAVQVAAQHETDPAARVGMAAGPIPFLIANQWNGLANATVDELRAIAAHSSPGADPLEDRRIHVTPAQRRRSRPWRVRTLSPRSRASTAIILNEVAHERASVAHHAIERIIADTATVQGYAPESNANIDVFFHTSHGTVLAEVKSCQQSNLHSQIRRGVGQLFEYRYVYDSELRQPVTLVLAIETAPSTHKQWLVSYLESLTIVLAWREPTQDRLVTTATIPPALAGLISPAR